MTNRQIAILIDGGFFLKRLPKLVTPSRCDTPERAAACIRFMCRNHVKFLTGDDDSRWHRHIYRIFYYDATPFDGVAHHPFENRRIAFAKSELSIWRTELFAVLRSQRNVALRLGKVVKAGEWSIVGKASQKVIATRHWLKGLDLSSLETDGIIRLDEKQCREAIRLQKLWGAIEDHHVKLLLKQKGVDMRIGLDMASLTLKKQAQTIVLVTGDSDFVPAAKLARREGAQLILDPMWQSVNDDLREHIDGLQCGLPKPRDKKNADALEGADDDLPEGASVFSSGDEHHLRARESAAKVR